MCRSEFAIPSKIYIRQKRPEDLVFRDIVTFNGALLKKICWWVLNIHILCSLEYFWTSIAMNPPFWSVLSHLIPQIDEEESLQVVVC